LQKEKEKKTNNAIMDGQRSFRVMDAQLDGIIFTYYRALKVIFYLTWVSYRFLLDSFCTDVLRAVYEKKKTKEV